MPTEIGLSIGIFAVIALLFMIGLKYLETLPPKPVVEPHKEEQTEATEQSEAAKEEAPEQAEASKTEDPPAQAGDENVSESSGQTEATEENEPTATEEN